MGVPGQQYANYIINENICFTLRGGRPTKALIFDPPGIFSDQKVWRYFLQIKCFLSSNSAHPVPPADAIQSWREEGGRRGAGWRVVPVKVPSFVCTAKAHCPLVIYPKLAFYSLSGLHKI